MEQQFFHWSVSPEIFSFNFIHVRWYGILFAMCFVVGYQIMIKIYNKEGKTEKQLESLSYYMIFSTVIGARLGHCLFYAPEYYLANPFEILKVWEGGLASHGAAVGIIFALWLYSKKQQDISLLWILDRIVLVVALSGFFIRLGNFFNSEILGMPTDVPWAIIFDRVDNVPRHPSQLYEAFAYLISFGILMQLYKKEYWKKEGFLFGLFLVLIFGVRFFVEFTKEIQVDFEKTLPLDMGQLLSIPLVLIGLYFLFRNRITKQENS